MAATPRLAPGAHGTEDERRLSTPMTVITRTPALPDVENPQGFRRELGDCGGQRPLDCGRGRSGQLGLE